MNMCGPVFYVQAVQSVIIGREHISPMGTLAEQQLERFGSCGTEGGTASRRPIH